MVKSLLFYALGLLGSTLLGYKFGFRAGNRGSIIYLDPIKHAPMKRRDLPDPLGYGSFQNWDRNHR